MNNGLNTQQLTMKIQKGWKPNQYLSNMSMAFFQDAGDYVADYLFPVCPVDFSTGYYYVFGQADLARDQVGKKPAYGKVQPAIMGQSDNTYKCEVDQVIVGIDQIATLNYQRAKTPGMSDPRRAKVRFATEQMKLHMDRIFAENFFKAGVWSNELTGVAANPGAGQFLKFTDANFEPIGFFDDLKRDMKRKGRRMPNKIGFGTDAYDAIKNHPEILDRVKYGGTSANPARVNENVLAQLLGVDKIVVLESTINVAPMGAAMEMKYVCDPKSVLMCYATDSPMIDEPSAGYIFSWDMLGNGQTMAFDQWEGENGTHTEFVEGLTSYDMKKTADDLAVFLKECV